MWVCAVGLIWAAASVLYSVLEVGSKIGPWVRSRCWPVKRYFTRYLLRLRSSVIKHETSLNNSLTLPKLSSGPLEPRNYEYTQTHSHSHSHWDIYLYVIYEKLFLFSQCTQVRLIAAQETNPRARAPIPCPDPEHPIGPGLAVLWFAPSVCLLSSISLSHQPDSSWPQLIWAHLGCKYYNDYRVIGPFGCSANLDQLQRVSSHRSSIFERK